MRVNRRIYVTRIDVTSERDRLSVSSNNRASFHGFITAHGPRSRPAKT